MNLRWFLTAFGTLRSALKALFNTGIERKYTTSPVTMAPAKPSSSLSPQDLAFHEQIPFPGARTVVAFSPADYSGFAPYAYKASKLNYM